MNVLGILTQEEENRIAGWRINPTFLELDEFLETHYDLMSLFIFSYGVGIVFLLEKET